MLDRGSKRTDRAAAAAADPAPITTTTVDCVIGICLETLAASDRSLSISSGNSAQTYRRTSRSAAVSLGLPRCPVRPEHTQRVGWAVRGPVFYVVWRGKKREKNGWLWLNLVLEEGLRNPVLVSQSWPNPDACRGPPAYPYRPRDDRGRCAGAGLPCGG